MTKLLACPYCGNTDIRRDADAQYDPSTKQWVLAGLYDEIVCSSDACNGRSVNPVEVEPSGVAALGDVKGEELLTKEEARYVELVRASMQRELDAGNILGFEIVGLSEGRDAVLFKVLDKMILTKVKPQVPVLADRPAEGTVQDWSAFDYVNCRACSFSTVIPMTEALPHCTICEHNLGRQIPPNRRMAKQHDNPTGLDARRGDTGKPS